MDIDYDFWITIILGAVGGADYNDRTVILLWCSRFFYF